MIDAATAARWVRRWDEQQEHYAHHREERFAAMTDLVARATAGHERPVLVDIGAGPGSMAARLADAVPHARVVAVESDPFLVALGRAWCGESVEFADETVGAVGWRARLDLPVVHAVVASAALHYPPVPRLAVLYVELVDWLAPDGILVNGDHFPDLEPGEAPAAPDLEPWVRWWEDTAAAPELAPLLALRASRGSADEGDGDNGLSAAAHLELLRSAGSRRVDVVWRRGRSGIIAARP